jgi:hypothetical protein
VWRAKNSGVVRLLVASHDTALAPFSQNSNDDPSRGSGQAQPGQSKPSGWLTFIMMAVPRVDIWPRIAFATACSAPQPPAGPPYSPIPGTCFFDMRTPLIPLHGMHGEYSTALTA